MNIGIIVPAAGSGQRFGGDVPKQYRLLAGVPVIVRTISALRRAVGEVPTIVAADAAWLEYAQTLLAPLGSTVTLCHGGTTRQESVSRALDHPALADTEMVIVHDAVRPLVSVAMVRRVVDAAVAHGAAVPVMPSKDTIKLLDSNGRVESTMPRGRLAMAQTPQVFRRELLVEAHRAATTDRFEATDDASVVEYLGHPVVTVAGEEYNLKITTLFDWEIVEYIITTTSHS
ncbi:MAG: 2-C-methyl-D-erythritol 4-phosphate cytidylyltransferase [Chlorobi bacterium]|nr:2-C-methyl-D-erythritol 4-phosphate cytidylyltransferase [Chlorobiota bacterium]